MNAWESPFSNCGLSKDKYNIHFYLGPFMFHTHFNIYYLFFCFSIFLEEEQRKFIFSFYILSSFPPTFVFPSSRGFWKYTIEAMAAHHHKQMKGFSFPFVSCSLGLIDFKMVGIVTILHKAIGYFGRSHETNRERKYLTGINTVQAIVHGSTVLKSELSSLLLPAMPMPCTNKELNSHSLLGSGGARANPF